MAEILGRQVTLSIPASDDFASGITLYGQLVRVSVSRPTFEATRFGDAAQRVVLGNYEGSFSIRFLIDSASTAVPRIPTGTVFASDLTLAPGIASGSTDVLGFSCAVTGWQYEAQATAGSPPQSIVYNFVITPATSDAAGTNSITYS